MAHKRLIWLLILLPLSLWAQTITIGNGTLLNQGLPIEPVARYSYSQQLFLAPELIYSGSITHLGFQYNVGSTGFLVGNKQLKVFLGHSSLSTLDDWVNIQSLSEVFNGVLSMDYFDSGLPGSGWLTIPLQNPFSYDSQYNLLIAVDENSDGMGNTSDDFFCRSTSDARALQFQSMSINPDPANPPDNPGVKTSINNLRISFSGTPDAPQNLHGQFLEGAIQLFWDAPDSDDIAAFRINRNGSFLAECSPTYFVDSNISAGATYHYNVQIRYQDGSISGASNTIQITVPPEGTVHLIAEGFEALDAFSSVIPRWQNLDLDASATWAWEHTDFPHEGEAMSWLVFSPTLCTPAISDLTPHSGNQMLMATASITPPNNDWLISPYLHLGNAATLTFTARSYTAAYGLERLRVLISTTDTNPASFQTLNAGSFLAVPASWTEYYFELSEYSDQDVWLAFNCVSLDALALFLDDVLLSSEGGHLDAAESLVTHARIKNYPNPGRQSFKLESPDYFEAKIYNLKGQLLHSAKGQKQFDSASIQLPAGIYLIRIKDAKGSYTLKQAVLP